MGKKLATYNTTDNTGYCEVHFDYKEERGYIKYFDNNGKLYYTEHFPEHSVRNVHEEAEKWSLGIKKLEEQYG